MLHFSEINKDLMKYDTKLNDDVIEWIRALYIQGHVVEEEHIVMVCRFSNWLKLKKEWKNGKRKNGK